MGKKLHMHKFIFTTMNKNCNILLTLL